MSSSQEQTLPTASTGGTRSSALWRRLDRAGHDACRLQQVEEGWELEGTTVFRHGTENAVVHYEATCDLRWIAQWGRISGWIGERSFDLAIVRTEEGTWTLDGVVVPGLEGCVDLDFGFTPATNLFLLRRLELAQGAGVDVPVAWLDVPAEKLERLPQRYERRSEHGYWHAAPTVGYAGLLEMTDVGFVRRYPGLWELEE